MPSWSPSSIRPCTVRRFIPDRAEQQWEAYCHHSFVFVFGSAGEARAWFADRDDIVVIPLSEAFDVIRAVADNLAYSERLAR